MGRNGGGEPDIEELLEAVERGRPGAMDALVSAIYPDLKRLAHFQLARERPDHTLSTTEIVHEAFLRLGSNSSWNSRNHFMRAAARVMRHLLVDYVRKRTTEKRGGAIEVQLRDDHSLTAEDDMAVLALNDAIETMVGMNPRLESIIECRYFAGLTVKETADTLGMSVRSVERDWQRARAYLLTAMESDLT